MKRFVLVAGLAVAALGLSAGQSQAQVFLGIGTSPYYGGYGGYGGYGPGFYGNNFARPGITLGYSSFGNYNRGYYGNNYNRGYNVNRYYGNYGGYNRSYNNGYRYNGNGRRYR